MQKTKEKLYIKVPSSIVRNEDFTITADEYLLYSRLCFWYFRLYQNKEIKMDVNKLKKFLKISDNRTLKAKLNNLYKYRLIENKIESLPRKKEITIVFNDELYNSFKQFTFISADLFDLYKEGKINCDGFRLIMYYKSHINRKTGNNYCFVGYATLATRLKISNSTIQEANNKLLKEKLLKIEINKLEPTYEYNEQDEIIFTKYNNHYYVAERLH